MYLLFSLSYPKTEPLESLVHERPKLNRLQFPLLIYRKIKLPLHATTPRPTTRMVTLRCSSTSTPGSRYSRVDKIGTPLGKCGLNVLLPTERVDRRIIRQPVEEHIRIVSSISQSYVA